MDHRRRRAGARRDGRRSSPAAGEGRRRRAFTSSAFRLDAQGLVSFPAEDGNGWTDYRAFEVTDVAKIVAKSEARSLGLSPVQGTVNLSPASIAALGAALAPRSEAPSPPKSHADRKREALAAAREALCNSANAAQKFYREHFPDLSSDVRDELSEPFKKENLGRNSGR